MYICMCVYVFMYVCIIYVHIYMYACIYIYVCVYVYTHVRIMHVRVYLCMYDCMSVCVYVCTYVRVCTYVCMYIYLCTYVCTYISMYVCECYACMFVCIYICTTCTCIYYASTCVCMYVYVYARMYLFMYVFVYVRMSTIWTCLLILVKPGMKVRHWISPQRRNCKVLPWPVTTCGNTEGRTDMAKQTVALGNFANRDKNQKRNLSLSLPSMHTLHLTSKLQSSHLNTPQSLLYRAISTNNPVLTEPYLLTIPSLQSHLY